MENETDKGFSDIRATLATDGQGGVPPIARKRGRPPGVKSEKRLSPPPLPLDPIAEKARLETMGRHVVRLFELVFRLLAVRTDCTVWLLEESEAKDLGDSWALVMSDLGLIDSKTLNLIFACGSLAGIVGAKAIIYKSYKSQLAEKAKALSNEAVAEPKKDNVSA